MKIIDAVWEKRNLGVTCTEFNTEPKDTPDILRIELANSEQEYNVLKIPAGRTELLVAAQSLGYLFIEVSVNVTHDLRKFDLTSIQKRLIESVSYSLMDNGDINQLYKEISKGIFNTDRIYNDSHFTKEQATNRYIGWISDELNRGSEAYKLEYGNNTVGFFTFKETDKSVYYPFLAGIYSEYSKSGLGINTISKPIAEATERNGKMITSYISTNNQKTLNLHKMMNFVFNDYTYVFIKHL